MPVFVLGFMLVIVGGRYLIVHVKFILIYV